MPENCSAEGRHGTLQFCICQITGDLMKALGKTPQCHGHVLVHVGTNLNYVQLRNENIPKI